jgi:Pyridoxamine 5''-phosphate oxidase.
MITNKFKEVLEYEGSVALTSWGAGEKPHVTGTWISYLKLTADERLLAPAAGMHALEEDIKINDKIYVMLGVREVEGKNGYQGIGFRLTAQAKLISSGLDYEMMKEKYPFLRAVLELTPIELEQLL